MAVIKLHGFVHSIAARRALACIYEKELDFEFVNVDMQAGEHKKQPYISLNPFGQLPALEDGDLKLFESRAITQYIAQTYPNKGTKLTGPAPGIQFAQVLVWQAVEAHQFDPPTLALIWELVFNPIFGKSTDAAVVEENEAKLAKVLDVYEARLATSKYLACDSFTLADLHHLPNLALLLGTQVKKLFNARPRVSAWVANITSRPAWVKVLAMAQ